MEENRYRIKQLRLEHKLSQRALADAIDCSQKAIDYWEKGSSEPSASSILKLANFFGCSTDYLLGRENDIGNIIVDYKFDSDELFLLFRYKNLSPQNKLLLRQYADFLTQKPDV